MLWQLWGPKLAPAHTSWKRKRTSLSCLKLSTNHYSLWSEWFGSNPRGPIHSPHIPSLSIAKATQWPLANLQLRQQQASFSFHVTLEDVEVRTYTCTHPLKRAECGRELPRVVSSWAQISQLFERMIWLKILIDQYTIQTY